MGSAGPGRGEGRESDRGEKKYPRHEAGGGGREKGERRSRQGLGRVHRSWSVRHRGSRRTAFAHLSLPLGDAVRPLSRAALATARIGGFPDSPTILRSRGRANRPAWKRRKSRRIRRFRGRSRARAKPFDCSRTVPTGCSDVSPRDRLNGCDATGSSPCRASPYTRGLAPHRPSRACGARSGRSSTFPRSFITLEWVPSCHSPRLERASPASSPRLSLPPRSFRSAAARPSRRTRRRPRRPPRPLPHPP